MENGQLPDPANWGVTDVVNYFKATGFEEQATAFQDQVGSASSPVRDTSRYPPYDSSKQTATSKSPSPHPTGNRWQVASPDDPERRPHRTVHKTRPRAQNLRVSREAAANPAPEDQRLIAPQAIGVAHLSDNHGVRRSPLPSSPQSAPTSQRLLQLLWQHLSGTWMLYVLYAVGILPHSQGPERRLAQWVHAAVYALSAVLQAAAGELYF